MMTPPHNKRSKMRHEDNGKYILKEIEKNFSKEKNRIKKEFSEKTENMKKEIREKTEKALSQIEESRKKEEEKLKKQRDSNFELKRSQRILKEQSNIYARTVEKAKELIFSSKDQLNLISEMMITQIEKNSDKEIKRFLIHKDAQLHNLNGKKVEPILEEPKVIGIINENEEFEISFEDLLKENNKEIYETISKTLF